ncbi:transposase [Leptospirillum ferriphilum ML-04]|uniref:Transposase n=1 Tax=Leptospirillum ferriphilum (strain ML-04) TaxID=1048260 RepID=J9ZC61_LEPFM|nr:transposase [Leptospirillum ferriphilum ML-04]
MIEAAIQAELPKFLKQFERKVTTEGKRGVIRNGRSGRESERCPFGFRKSGARPERW